MNCPSSTCVKIPGGSALEAETKRVLVVEDEFITARDLKASLLKLGYEVIGVTASGQDAIRKARKLRPDLVLMDITLKGSMNGIEAAAEIWKSLSIPIIYLTAHVDTETIDRAKVTEPFGYLPKPWNQNSLKSALIVAFHKSKVDVKVRESEERYRSLVEQSPLAITMNHDHKFVYSNPAAAHLFGVTQKEGMSGRNITEFIHPDFSTQILERMAAQPEMGESTPVVERFVRVDGTEFTAEVVSQVMTCKGMPVVQTIIRDITDRKRAEEEKAKLESQNRQLLKSESLRRMAGAIAHTFNNHLTVVIGNLELALTEQTQGAQPILCINSAMRAAEKAAAVSGLMLTYLGQSFDKRETIDLSEVCLQSLPILQSAMIGNVVLKSDLPTPGPAVHASGKQMQDILTNLFTNACEAVGDDQGFIGLSVKRVAAAEIPAAHRHPIEWQPKNTAYACLEVTDTGAGITDKDIENLFDPFFSSKFTGRGLGLAVVLGLAKAHGGAITVDSKLGQGSTFRVFLPVTTEEYSRQTNQTVRDRVSPDQGAHP